MKLNNRTALITGGARGIGLGFAQAYAREGAKVVIADIDFERATQAAAATGPAASAKKLDVSDLAAIESVAAEVDREFGGIDILVNNAAIFDMAPITDITEASYEKVFGINLKGPLFMMKAVANLMIARGRGGKIINMASQAGRRGEALVTLYCASKAAIISATQSAALALVKHGINVNAIAPGVVDGEHWDVVDAHFARWEGLKPGEKKAAVAKSVPIGRFARPEDIAGLAVFLASSDSDYILAQTYNVDGGNWMS
ncbi:MAG: L-iditol 2-dehydrogenase [Mesorhizobium sp.]|uniref:L-iditol 2-dehydrogenase n=1 Tax=unclassified Mesorhizobium TaxID=325217 RepID=UPI000F753B28|nr:MULTISPECIES: L-iditol 2-dehydrogenase [unclassified Mesorhizobium]AZO47813.1 L-iditol 2-dehydrogenase [Mesorhizobium sp. M4B.F.Ca.ET.058.02.1.1]RWC52116.1 MAG: L-iditol 2-dehydrogenase [Mesorhizobium sp.]RWD12063.1 MAG: L-iditol 2-dehydrogenase [Mesorhizobium sp.]RWD54358.1 MAG: L-iditol 2-dehydrogenase [Mesorhizobium sp.]TIV79948.1 MAG: L-iditol 2-dehydrogenase [Mesorhizobium sp.]